VPGQEDAADLRTRCAHRSNDLLDAAIEAAIAASRRPYSSSTAEPAPWLRRHMSVTGAEHHASARHATTDSKKRLIGDRPIADPLFQRSAQLH